ncbi:hypothetical protein G3I59_09400 [Amycolatopsis rubida]|uniref:PEP-utilising enzyme C-terminal domain-containing protein n=1 Tax=Amycolatopsis rubida TaxID=112413 RepID=A0ABX0BKC4_9PSEU|nr:hypothetical protein [Amycolatopsis rubida]
MNVRVSPRISIHELLATIDTFVSRSGSPAFRRSILTAPPRPCNSRPGLPVTLRRRAVRLTVALSYERFDETLAAHFDGVGLIRGEYVFRAEGCYPAQESVRKFLEPYLRAVAATAAPRRVWYRTMEVDTAEANVLEGVEAVLVEEDRLLGLRGIRRSRTYPEAFRAELRGVATARAAGADVGVIIPFVTYAEELEWAVAEIDRHASGTPVATMLETPAALVELDRLLGTGISRVVIGCNDLSSLLLARSRSVRGPVEPASPLLRAIELARRETSRIGAELAVAGYLSPELISACRTLGVDECVVHYSDLPKVFGPQWNDLPDLGLLAATKARTRAAIAEFNARNGFEQRVY